VFGIFLYVCLCVFFLNSSMCLVDLRISMFMCCICTLYQALCSMSVAATGPLLLILLIVEHLFVTFGASVFTPATTVVGNYRLHTTLKTVVKPSSQDRRTVSAKGVNV